MHAILGDLTKDKIKALGSHLCKWVLLITLGYTGIYENLISWEPFTGYRNPAITMTYYEMICIPRGTLLYLFP